MALSNFILVAVSISSVVALVSMVNAIIILVRDHDKNH